ncbi:MAG: DUF5103 domain-containing protein [Alloprevotella sp.]
MNRLFFIFLIFLLTVCDSHAQPGRVKTFDEKVKSVRLKIDGNAERPAVLQKGERLELSFDYIDPVVHRFTYRVDLLTFNGELTDELFDSEYVRQTEDFVPLDDAEPSEFTRTHYMHYRLTLPNTDAVPLLSGNYRISVFEDNDDSDEEKSPVFTADFGILDVKATIGIAVSTDTDIDRNRSHQQVSVKTLLRNVSVTDAEREIRLLVFQNRRFDNFVTAPAPSYIYNGQLDWQHCQALIFPARNEYRRFEIISSDHPGMGVDRVRKDGDWRDHHLIPDEKRKNYVFYEERNGLFVPRTDWEGDADLTADYVRVHFQLLSPEIPGAECLLQGHWTPAESAMPYRLNYNELNQAYEGAFLMKTGYYDYQYVFRSPDGAVSPSLAEGDFFQTENEYMTLLYHRPLGSRHWQLIGHSVLSFRQ